MSMAELEEKRAELAERVLAAFYKVHGTLGYGFTESIYETALAVELRSLGMKVVQQAKAEVFYEGHIVGHYIFNLVVNDRIVLDVKTINKPTEEHAAQLMIHLKATRIEAGLILNFGPEAQVKRRFFDNDLKGTHSWIHP